MDQNYSNKVRIRATNKFVGFSDGNILSWCPTMDLLAVSMNKMSIWVFRLNGERIYSLNNRAPILDISWNPDGKYFCLSGADGYCKIYDSCSGNLVNVVANKQQSIDLINWCVYDIEGEEKNLADLFRIDILGQLPKLSLSYEWFGNQITQVANTDLNKSSFYLDQFNNSNNSKLNYLVSVNSKSQISLTFNNLYTIDNIVLPTNLNYLSHASNKELFQQHFLALNNDTQRLELVVLLLGIPSHSNCRHHFVNLITYLCKIVCLVGFVKEQISLVVSEVKPFFEFFDRHLSNLKDSLYESVDLTVHFPTDEELKQTIVECFYEIFLTGMIPENLKDYFSNQFGERNWKRLYKMGNNLFDLIRKVFFNEIILSMERLIIILNHIKGSIIWFSNFGEEGDFFFPTFGLSTKCVEDTLKYCEEFLKMGYQIIWEVNEEQKYFNDFMNCVKAEILEKLAKADNMDSYYSSLKMNYKKGDVIKYLNEYLFSSKLFRYFVLKECSFEVIRTNTNNLTYDLVDGFSRLLQLLNGGILSGVANYVRSVSIFKTAISLSLLSHNPSPRLDFAADQSHGIIASLNDRKNSLSLIKFDTKEQKTIIQKYFNVDDHVINYALYNGSEIIILYEKNSKCHLGIFEVADIFSIPKNECYLDMVDQKKEISFDATNQTNVRSPKYLTINGNQHRRIGCVLDSNRQNYTIFNLD